jgi:hypothetical protein
MIFIWGGTVGPLALPKRHPCQLGHQPQGLGKVTQNDQPGLLGGRVEGLAKRPVPHPLLNQDRFGAGLGLPRSFYLITIFPVWPKRDEDRALGSFFGQTFRQNGTQWLQLCDRWWYNHGQLSWVIGFVLNP